LILPKKSQTAKAALEYKSNLISVNTQLVAPFGKGTSVSGAFVFGHSHAFGHFYAGAEANYAFATSKITALNVALANKLHHHILTVNIRQEHKENASLKFLTSYYYKPKDNKSNLEVGGELEKDVHSNDVGVHALFGFDLDANTRVKAKVNSHAHVHLVLQHTVNANLKINVGLNFLAGHVKPGLSLTLNN